MKSDVLRSISFGEHPFASALKTSSCPTPNSTLTRKSRDRPRSCIGHVSLMLPFSETENRFLYPTEPDQSLNKPQQIIREMVNLRDKKDHLKSSVQIPAQNDPNQNSLADDTQISLESAHVHDDTIPPQPHIDRQIRTLWNELQKMCPVMEEENGNKIRLYHSEPTLFEKYQEEMNELLATMRSLHKSMGLQLCSSPTKKNTLCVEKIRWTGWQQWKMRKETKQCLFYILTRIGLANANKVALLQNQGTVREILCRLLNHPLCSKMIKNSGSLKRQFHTAIKNATALYIQAPIPSNYGTTMYHQRLRWIRSKIKKLEKEKISHLAINPFDRRTLTIQTVESIFDIFLESAKLGIYSTQVDQTACATMELLSRFTILPPISKVMQQRDDLVMISNAAVKLLIG